MTSGVEDVVMTGPLLVAGVIAVAAGLLSFFSPCCLPLVPGYLSWVTGSAASEISVPASAARTAPVFAGGPAEGPVRAAPVDRAVPEVRVVAAPRSRTVLGTVLMVLGFSVVFTSYGAAFGSIGFFLLEHQRLLTVAMGATLILMGLLFAGALRFLPASMRTFKPSYRPRAGLIGAPVMGGLFALGWTPCIGPTLAAVLALSMSTGEAWRGAVLAFLYSVGLGIPFIVASLLAQRGFRVFNWPRRHARGLMTAGGLMLIIIGVLQITGAWAMIMSGVQSLIAGWQLPL